MALSTAAAIAAYMGFLDQTHATSMAVVANGDNWELQLNGVVIYSLPNETIANDLLAGFQAGAGPSIAQAQTDAKAAIIALVPAL